MNKILIDLATAQQALEALENAVRYHGIMLMADPPQDAWKYHRVEDNAKQAITALREALAQPEQEPVAWNVIDPTGNILATEKNAIRGWARVNGYKLTVEGLLGLHELGWRVLPTSLPAAQPEQEPVAWRYHPVSPFRDKEGMHKVSDAWKLIDKPNQRDAHSAMCGMEAEPLYTAPPQRKPLTEEMRKQMLEASDNYEMRGAFANGWLSAEAAHGIKEQS